MRSEQTVSQKKRGLKPAPSAIYKELLEKLKKNRQSVEAHVEVARFLLRMKKADKAISSLKVAKSLQPGKLTVYLLLGWALQQIEKLVEARLCYKQLLNKDHNSISGNFQMAMVLIKLNKPLEATDYLKKTIELHRGARKSLAVLASIANEQGDLNKALSYTDSLLEKNPDCPGVLLQAGKIQYSAGRPSRAISPLKRALTLNPSLTDASFLLAKIYIEEGLPSEAFNVISPVLSKDSSNFDFKLLEGKAHEGNEDKNRAIASFISASKLKPADCRPHLHLGTLYLKHSDLELAERELIEALKLGPEQALIYRTLSMLYQKSGQIKKAENILIEMSEMFIHSPEPWRLIGELRLATDDSEGSVVAFSQAIEKSPADAHLFCARAQAHVLNGAYDEAIEDFDRARELDPDVEAAKRENDLISNHKNFIKAREAWQKAEEARTDGNLDSSRKHYERALELAPDNEKWLRTYGQLSVYCGKFTDAVEAIKRLVAVTSSAKSGALFQLGNLYFGLNNFDAAFKCYEKSATLNPLFIPARLRLIETIGQRLVSGSLSPDRFPRILAAYNSELANPSRESVAHLELGWLYLHGGTQILPTEEWSHGATLNFEAAGEASSAELIRFKYLGVLNLQRRLEQHDAALETLMKLTNLQPSNTNYAIALLEHLKFLKYYSRGLRTSEQLLQRFPGNGLIMAMNLEFFALTAMTQKSGPNICAKRLNEIQRLLLKNQENGNDYLLLGLALVILKSSDQKFETSKKAVTALNKAFSLLENNPWPLWAMVREKMQTNILSKGNTSEELSDEIRGICEQGLRTFPDFVPFIELLGRQMVKSKDPVESDKGRIMLERAVLIDQDSPAALYSLANHYLNHKDHTTVRHLLSEFSVAPEAHFLGQKY